MPSTTIHFPPDVLAQIDQAAARRGTSRNRFVIAACQSLLESDAGVWPDGFFDSDLSEEDADILTDATREMEQAIATRRVNRGASLL